MRKLFVALSLLIVAWMVKLNYDLVQNSKQLQELQTRILHSEQANANANDQLVALQRQLAPNEATASDVASSESAAVHALNPIILVKQQLQLVQFALQQQQDVYAFQQLQKLNQEIAAYDLSPALQQSLYQAITQDLQNIQQYHDNHQNQLDQLHLIFRQMDQQLNQLLLSQAQQYQPVQQKHFWNRWFKVESTDQPQTELMNQRLVLKEMQIRLVLAKQLLESGQYDEYQQTLLEVNQLLRQAPTFNRHALSVLLEKAKQLPAVTMPKLTALAILN
ncbi:hypothetical protein P255_02380 [Acinetobacter brisouii CIP 110357]|uniref:Uncharacterized protein n=1 Tax=Acinetobacter brisouii CIP 110357 TaxID=1341683 RepID=V2U7W1_9GAMM|nr:hypothetical protein [Acinetobacter brisouii]ENV47096.1 hypothetical protein F954_01897 [Acinetobacter brisouii ANC 4119]ESK50398.1 hypothetical protein P255_02380 [Acinetobacter brisouii CIP 110357]